MKNKTYFILVFLLLMASGLWAQVENPVTWSYNVVKLSPKKFEIHMTASVSGNWHIYSQNAGEGPVPTSFAFNKNPLVKWDGKVAEIGKAENTYDPNFKSNLRFYNGKVDFVQKVTTKSTANTIVSGTITYMVCNDKKCLPPKDVTFSVPINNK